MPASPTTWTTGNLRETKYNSEKTHLHYHESLKHHIVLNCHSVPARGMRADLERYPGMDLRQAHQSVSARKSTTAGRYATIMMMTPICGATAAPRGTVASPRATDLRPPPLFLILSFSLPRRIAEWQGKTTSRRWRFQRSPSRMRPHSPSALPRHRRAGSQIRIRGPIP